MTKHLVCKFVMKDASDSLLYIDHVPKLKEIKKKLGVCNCENFGKVQHTVNSSMTFSLPLIMVLLVKIIPIRNNKP